MGNWKVLGAAQSFLSKWWDYIVELGMMASNLAYVFVMLLGFVMLPRKLMLVVAGIGVFVPNAIVWILNRSFEFARWVHDRGGAITSWAQEHSEELEAIGTSIQGCANELMKIPPWLISQVMGLFGASLGVAATNPSLAIFYMWLAAFLTSKLFQTLTLWLGLDINSDGRVGWRDLWVYIIGVIKDRSGPNMSGALGIDDLHSGATKQLRAVKQNEEILERVEGLERSMVRLESMLLTMGGPDLRGPCSADGEPTSPAPSGTNGAPHVEGSSIAVRLQSLAAAASTSPGPEAARRTGLPPAQSLPPPGSRRRTPPSKRTPSCEFTPPSKRTPSKASPSGRRPATTGEGYTRLPSP